MKSFRLNRIIFSVGAIAIGIILLVWPSTSLLIMGKCIGAFLAGGGLVAAFLYFRDHEDPIKSVLLIMAAVMLICGVVIFLHPDDLVKLIPTIMGILVVISGLINLGETFMLTRTKYQKWWVTLIIAIITIAAGIFLIKNAFSLAEMITRIAGAVLVMDGASDLWVISRVSKASKEFEAAGAVVATEAAAGGTGGTEGAGDSQEPSSAPSQTTEQEGAQTAEHTALQTEPQAESQAESQAAPQDGAQSAANTNEASEAQAAPDQGPKQEPAVKESGSEADVPEYLNQAEQDTDYEHKDN